MTVRTLCWEKTRSTATASGRRSSSRASRSRSSSTSRVPMSSSGLVLITWTPTSDSGLPGAPSTTPTPHLVSPGSTPSTRIRNPFDHLFATRLPPGGGAVAAPPGRVADRRRGGGAAPRGGRGGPAAAAHVRPPGAGVAGAQRVMHDQRHLGGHPDGEAAGRDRRRRVDDPQHPRRPRDPLVGAVAQQPQDRVVRGDAGPYGLGRGGAGADQAPQRAGRRGGAGHGDVDDQPAAVVVPVVSDEAVVGQG